LDHSSVTSSPRLIAGSYVLHRLLVPRHPPCALTNLTNKDARVHCAVLKVRAAPDSHRPPAPAPPQEVDASGTTQSRSARPGPSHPKVTGTHVAEGSSRSPIPQDPTACQAPTTPASPFPPPEESCTRQDPRDRRQLTDVPPVSTLPETRVRGRGLDATPRRAGARCSLERR
jgi:hypothetical protein